MEIILYTLMSLTLLACIACNIYEIYNSNKAHKRIMAYYDQMMHDLEVKRIEKLKDKAKKIRKDFTYRDSNGTRDLAGKMFIVDREVTPDEVDKKAMKGNMACLNFCLRRDDFLPGFNKKLYYGRVEDEKGFNLGYVMCEDELEKEI